MTREFKQAERSSTVGRFRVTAGELNMLSLKLSAPVIGGFSALLLALGLYGLTVESAPFLSSAGTPANRLQSIEDAPAISTLSSKRALGVYELDCRSLALDMAAGGTPEERGRVDRACFERTKSLLKAAPGNARFWLNLAQFGSRLPGERDLVLQATKLSRLYGPWQYSFATDRVALINSLADAPDDIQKVLDADMKTLAASVKGRQDLAKLYIANPQLRTRIGEAIATRSVNSQNDFVGFIQSALKK